MQIPAGLRLGVEGIERDWRDPAKTVSLAGSGNIRCALNAEVEEGGAAVIFDWGMTRSLSDEERLGLAFFFHSLANMDVSGLQGPCSHHPHAHSWIPGGPRNAEFNKNASDFWGTRPES